MEMEAQQPNGLYMRRLPNVCICGTPGAGKTTLSKRMCERDSRFRYIDINKEAKLRDCVVGRDEELNCDIVDEDKLVKKLVDELEPELEKGGFVIDWIHANMWDNTELVDLVICVRVTTETLHDRLKARKYSERKIQENIDAEIFGEIASECELDHHDGAPWPNVLCMVEVEGDTEEELQDNLLNFQEWVSAWSREESSTPRPASRPSSSAF